MLVIGLTGGIGSGKSTVARLFAELGVPVIDTDLLARELVEPGEAAFEEVVAAFGPEILAGDGRLDRPRLRGIVFADPHKRRQLEAILHPRIRAAVRERINALETPYCIVAIPLLVETAQRDLVDRVLVIDVPPEVQLSRAAARDGVPEEQVRAIMASQACRAERLAAADDVIANEGDIEQLRTCVTDLHTRYMTHSQEAGHD